MSSTIIEDNPFEFELFEENGSGMMAADIKTYFETNQNALEVLIFKGKRVLPVNRIQVQSPDFNRVFRKRYEK